MLINVNSSLLTITQLYINYFKLSQHNQSYNLQLLNINHSSFILIDTEVYINPKHIQFDKIRYITSQNQKDNNINIIKKFMIDNYRKRRTFVSDGRRFIIDSCIWRRVDKEIQKKRPFQMNIYMHTLSILNDNLYIYGGMVSKSQGEKMMHSIYLKSNQWRGWSGTEKMGRNSHSAATHDGCLYFFGGNDLISQYNDLRTFQPNFNKWTTTESIGNLPSPRSRANLLSINGFLLLIGGINTFTGQVYDDAFLWKDNKWFLLSIQNPPTSRINYKIIKCGLKLFMFGGQSTAQLQAYYNQLYELKLDTNNFKLTYILSVPQTKSQPKQRSSHCMISISQHYFVIIGGETNINLSNQNQSQTNLQNNAQNNEQNNVQNNLQNNAQKNAQNSQKVKDIKEIINVLGKRLRDIWVFDISENQWLQVQPKNSPLNYLSCTEGVLYKNVIYLFGGIDEKGKLMDDLVMIKFGEDEMVKSQICNWCIERENKDALIKTNFPKKPTISVGFLYNLSLEIKFPFQAIANIIDGAVLMQCESLQIKYKKTEPTDLIYIDIEFDGKSFSNYLSNQIPIINKITQNFLLGSFRLGKTILFVTTNEKSRKVFMISAESKITPQFDETYKYYAYIEDIESGIFSTHEGLSQKNLIYNILKGQFVSPSEVICCKKTNKLVILSHNCIMSINKIYYSQLVSFSPEDISIYKNQKKIQFLENAGLDLSKNPQISLATYISLMYITSHLKITLNNSSNIHFINYQTILSKMAQAKQIFPFEITQKLPGIDIFLYGTDEENFMKQNHGILIYYHDRLVNRLNCQFGELFQEKFYKNKYKKMVNLWKVLGIIKITNEQIKLNFLKNNLENSLSNQDYLISIRQIVQKYTQQYFIVQSDKIQSANKKLKAQ